MFKRDTLLLLEDMLESAQKIKRYTNELDYEAFLSDDRTVDAVVRNFEIIGEAGNRLDQEFRFPPPPTTGSMISPGKLRQLFQRAESARAWLMYMLRELRQPS